MERHVQHNRFWQKEIAGDKKRFDRLTRLYDAMRELHSIRVKLGEAAALPVREQELATTLNENRMPLRTASFLKVLHLQPRLWLIQVPLYTDIRSEEFIQDCVQTIERVWHVKDGDSEFRLEILLHSLDPNDLYSPDDPPAKATHIDVAAHVARFPKDGGVLTTGASSTYAIAGRYVSLGPEEISTSVVAHEFGHILGFRDGYFRGYRDIGVEGYEVLEVVPDPTDIMNSPGLGQVQHSHFEALISGLKKEE